jgi:molybdate transport system substrate-binding protein
MTKSVFLLALLLACTARADEVTIAVAANFAGPMAKIAESFTAASGHVVKIASASTGKLYTQIKAGAPFEVLLAADEKTPSKLIAEGHAVAGSNFTYAIGQLVLWSAQPGLVDDQGAVLAQGKFAHLAVANPKFAPYGLAATEVLKARGLTAALAPRVVMAENIAQTYQFVLSGNAELGFVALSQVSTPGQPARGSIWHIPQSLYGQIRQDAVLLKPGANSRAAAELLAYLKSAPAKAMIQSYGYGS